MGTSYIGADVDSKMTDLAVERGGRIVRRFRVPTTIPALVEVLGSVRGPKELVFEEGPMAQWLHDHLSSHVDKLVVCDPRRNRLISQDGDSDDVIDATKLAALLRGGYLREVHHSDNGRHVELRQWVGLYHDRVKEAVRQLNKVRGRCQMFGLRPPRGVLRNVAVRKQWLNELGSHPLGPQARMLLEGYDAAAAQVRCCRQEMTRRARGIAIVTLWQELPGVGPIRALTVYAYLETPWRFGNNPKKLWKYCGVGLVRSSSGKDKQGRPKVGLLQLAWQVNRRLKAAVMGAAVSAIQQGENVFAQQHARLLAAGVTPGNARHSVARKLLSVQWSMWKTGRPFDASCVLGGASNDTTTATAALK
jgi:transposase